MTMELGTIIADHRFDCYGATQGAQFCPCGADELNAELKRLRDGFGIYELREAGYRVLDEDQCCALACSGGACESCPCCRAGWCVSGRDDLPERDLAPASDYRIWLDEAAEHNPVAKRLAEIEGVVGIDYDEPVPALAQV